jgi:predicted nuclease of predicted toxin-antitoxin system
MADHIRFHLDESVDPDIAPALRSHGIDVTTTGEAGLRTRSDADQLEFSRTRNRVIVTHDADYVRFAQQSSNHSGIAYCSSTARSLGEIIRSLILIYEVLRPEEIKGQVEYL